MFLVFALPLLGLVLAALINRLIPKAKIRGYDVLPFFFIAACQQATSIRHYPSFLPYAFLFYFILVILVSILTALKNKNISFGKTFRRLWNYLTLSSIFWYLAVLLLFMTL